MLADFREVVANASQPVGITGDADAVLVWTGRLMAQGGWRYEVFHGEDPVRMSDLRRPLDGAKGSSSGRTMPVARNRCTAWPNAPALRQDQ